jgi:hypothetical protein
MTGLRRGELLALTWRTIGIGADLIYEPPRDKARQARDRLADLGMIVVPPVGLEPTTYGLQNRCSAN